MSTDVKRMPLEDPKLFTSAIKSCGNSRAYDPDSPSIFHLKNLGPLHTKRFTSLYNESLKSCRLPSIWKTSLVIPIPKLDKDSSQDTSYRPISLLYPEVNVLETLSLPSINEFISPAKDQHDFRLDYICLPPAHNRHRDRLQPAETTSPYSVFRHRLDNYL